MPEFVLNTTGRPVSKPHPFYALSDFAKGYVEAMFFTNGDTADENENLLSDLGTDRLTREAVASIAADCKKFLNIYLEGFSVRARLNDQHGYDDEQAGRDFWFTRQGHGVGFDDREELNAAAKRVLYTAARQFGEANVEVSRGWIYHR